MNKAGIRVSRYSAIAVVVLVLAAAAAAGCGGGSTTGPGSTPVSSAPPGTGGPKVLVFTSPG